MTPSSISSLGGAQLKLTGGGFAPGATVTIGGQSCEDTTITPTAISCSTPSLTVGQYPVVVTNPGGQTSQWSSPLVAAIPAPTVTSVHPERLQPRRHDRHCTALAPTTPPLRRSAARSAPTLKSTAKPAHLPDHRVPPHRHCGRRGHESRNLLNPSPRATPSLRPPPTWCR
jgi:hypothetical protein